MMFVGQLAMVVGYCNGMSRMGYGPRTSKAFPPGWNGLAKTPNIGWRSCASRAFRTLPRPTPPHLALLTPGSCRPPDPRPGYAYYTRMDQPMIEQVIDALVAKNRTVPGWDGQVSLCDLGYCTAGIDEGWEGCGEGVNGA